MKEKNKARHLYETGENLFINNNIWNDFLDFCKLRLAKIIEAEK